MTPNRKTARPSTLSSSQSKLTCRLSLVGAAVALMLTGCGGGSGDGDNDGNGGSTSVGDVSAGDTSASADSVATEMLQQKASANAAQPLAAGFGGLSRLNEGSGAAGGLTSSLGGLAGSSDDSSVVDTDDDGLLVDEADIRGLDGNFTRLFDAMLGNQGAAAVSTREGNTVTINPDAREICAGEVYLIDEDDDTSACENLVSQMSVSLNAATEESGEMTILFNTDALLDVAYGPSRAVYDLNLDTVQLVMQNASQFSGESMGLPGTIGGSVRLASSISDGPDEATSGEASVEITRALTLRSGDDLDLSLAPSRVLKVVNDDVAGTASLTIGLGAVSLTAPFDGLPGDDDDDGFTFDSSELMPDTGLQGLANRLATLAMSGLTARIDVTNNGEQVSLSNIGLRNGPLTIAIDQVEALRVTLSTFGIDVDDATGSIALNGDFDLSLAVNNLMGFLDDESDPNDSADLRVRAPGGTQFGESQDGGIKVTAVGPVSIDATVVAEGTSSTQGVVVNVGECIESPDEDSLDAFLSAVACD